MTKERQNYCLQSSPTPSVIKKPQTVIQELKVIIPYNDFG